MPINNGQATSKPTLLTAFKALEDCINYNMNCVKVATVIEFDSDSLTVKCRVNNKRLLNLKDDGNQILQEYPDIYAKVHFFGWGDVGAIYPIEAGMEGLLLFNDRELETWYLTSEGGNLAYDRCHDLSDALFICGLHSQPKLPLVPFVEECLHIYYKGSDFLIKDESITENTKDFAINADTSYTLNTNTQTEVATNRNITATTNHTGTISATQLNDTTAATNTFTSADGKIVTVVNGIVRTIVG